MLPLISNSLSLVYHIEDDIITYKSENFMNINKKVTLQRIQTLTELHGAPGFWKKK